MPFIFFDFKTIISHHSHSLYTLSTPGQWQPQPHNAHSVSLLCFSLPLQCCLTLPPGAASSQRDQRSWEVAQKWCRAWGALWEQFWFFISPPSHSAELYQLPCSLQCLSLYSLSAVAVPEWNRQQVPRSVLSASTETIPSVIYYLSRRASLKSAMQIRKRIPTHTQSAEGIWSQTAEDTCRGGQKTVRVLPRETDMAAE